MRYLILALIFVSCGKTRIVEKELPAKTQVVEVETKKHYENIKCDSDGSYTECTIINNAVQIISLVPYRAEDCSKDRDYFLLDEKVLVVKNGCRATFIIEVE